MKALNKRIINHICPTHAIEYGIDKAKIPADKWIDGYCDVCEAKGIENTPQNVTEVANLGGIAHEELDTAKPVQDGVYEFKPSKEKAEALQIKEEKDGHNKKTPGTGPKPKKA